MIAGNISDWKPTLCSDGLAALPTPEKLHQIETFVERRLRSGRTDDTIGEVPCKVKQAEEVHTLYKTITRYGEVLSEIAREHATIVSSNYGNPVDSRVILTHSDIGRFTKALYIHQLVSDLFSRNSWNFSIHPPLRNLDKAFVFFWESFAPWESEQVRCILHLLVNHIRRGSHEKGN